MWQFNPCSPCCSNLAILICNSNAAVDDNFRIELNGNVLSEIDFSSAGLCNGAFYRTSATMTPDSNILGPDTCCNAADPDGVDYITINAALFNDPGSNTLKMVNIQSNFNNNFGIVNVARMLFVSGVWISETPLIIDNEYSGSTGASFTFNFNLT